MGRARVVSLAAARRRLSAKRWLQTIEAHLQDQRRAFDVLCRCGGLETVAGLQRAQALLGARRLLLRARSLASELAGAGVLPAPRTQAMEQKLLRRLETLVDGAGEAGRSLAAGRRHG